MYASDWTHLEEDSSDDDGSFHSANASFNINQSVQKTPTQQQQPMVVVPAGFQGQPTRKKTATLPVQPSEIASHREDDSFQGAVYDYAPAPAYFQPRQAQMEAGGDTHEQRLKRRETPPQATEFELLAPVRSSSSTSSFRPPVTSTPMESFDSGEVAKSEAVQRVTPQVTPAPAEIPTLAEPSTTTKQSAAAKLLEIARGKRKKAAASMARSSAGTCIVAITYIYPQFKTCFTPVC